jgi:hypothetical protein
MRCRVRDLHHLDLLELMLPYEAAHVFAMDPLRCESTAWAINTQRQRRR